MNIMVNKQYCKNNIFYYVMKYEKIRAIRGYKKRRPYDRPFIIFPTENYSFTNFCVETVPLL